MAGGAPTSLTPVSATRALRGLRPRTDPDRIRVESAKDLIGDLDGIRGAAIAHGIVAVLVALPSWRR